MIKIKYQLTDYKKTKNVRYLNYRTNISLES